jgi:glycine betaine catabolism B
MLKIKIFKAQSPHNAQELELCPNNLMGGEFLIGRLPSCNLVLPSSSVSRQHAKILLQDSVYHFIDLGSSGGSWLNEVQAIGHQTYELKPGDLIRVADYHLELSIPEQYSNETIVVPSQTMIAASIAKTKMAPDTYMPVACIDPTQIERWTKGELTVRCSRVIEETQDAKTFRFVASPPVLFTYKPGQFVTLDLDIEGESVLRSYSISSTPSRPHTLEITVKRVLAPTDSPDAPSGLVSNWLHDNLKAGSSLKLSGPFGKFTNFANPAQKLLLISAGSGITPMMSMSRWIYDTASNCDVVFLHSARSPEDIIYRQELEMMACRQPNFQLALTMTKPHSSQGWFGFTGRISETLIRAVAPDFGDRTVYVCGPESFMESAKTLMTSLNFPMENYYEESFGPPKKAKKGKKSALKEDPTVDNIVEAEPPKVSRGFGLGAALEGLRGNASSEIKDTNPAQMPSPPTDPAPQNGSGMASSLAVVFSKSGKEVTCDGEECILDIAEQEGVKIRSSCRAGSCGSCKKLKTAGEVRMEGFDPEALEPEEQAAGYILTCVSYPIGRVVVEA